MKLNIIVSSDTDYVAYLGKDCTCLKDFKYNSITNTISEFISYTTTEIEIYRWSLVLDWNEFIEKPLLSQKAKFPIFDNENDPKVRAVCEVAMGRDM